MKKTREYASARTSALRTPATLSKYFSSIDDLRPGQRLVLYVRASGRNQKDNMTDQRANLEREVAKRGFSIIAIFEEIVSGWEECRTEFERAVLQAKAVGVPIVAESVNRFKRCWRYHKERRHPPLNVFEMKRLMAEADGVPLATVVPPDATPKEVRDYESRRGQSGNYGGRPKERFPKKAIRLRNQPKAMALRMQGLSYRQIGERSDVHWSTVRDWIKKTFTQKTAHPLTDSKLRLDA